MDVFAPEDMEEALAIKADRPDSVPIAGGTDVMVDLNFGRRNPSAILDLSRVAELSRWEADDDVIFLGAGLSYASVQRELAFIRPLAAASRTIGSPQIRNRGTIGGNLGTASPAGDILPVLAAFDADIVVARAGGYIRSTPWNSFLIGPKRNGLEPNELIVGVRWRRVRGPGIFSKIGWRNAMVIAVANLCLVLDEELRSVRVSVGSVAPTVIRVPKVEEMLEEGLISGGVWDDRTSQIQKRQIQEAARLIERSVAPIDDMRASAQYRRQACGVMLQRAMSWALQDRLERGNETC